MPFPSKTWRVTVTAAIASGVLISDSSRLGVPSTRPMPSLVAHRAREQGHQPEEQKPALRFGRSLPGRLDLMQWSPAHPRCRLSPLCCALFFPRKTLESLAGATLLRTLSILDHLRRKA